MALAADFHSIRVEYFQKSGGDGLNVSYEGPGIKKKIIDSSVLFH